ncbi:ComF family protein [Actinophytocola oryzae]|uniref:Putative amidophosphoribosyltransferase n=1 Tax=Actinophytocola oryzae TaxID=502181 RepID=A0A4R7VRQ7_9PSEU|nr:ComF family protein [Actinophytocola oryzae]TDV52500.1 putative amidophosphoribosyltransferase [Actinophytocola oryzae]
MRSILDLVLPDHCAGCDLPGTPWCPACARSLGVVRVPRPGLRHAYALTGYTGPARRAVLAYKEKGRHRLSGVLGGALAAALPTIRAGPFTLVPAPSRPSAARARYGQHMVAVARACALALTRAGHQASVAPVLRLSGRARDSVGLDPRARVANLSGRLRTSGPGPPSAVLLDDVITTGATAVACVAALAAAGTRQTTVLAFTATA